MSSPSKPPAEADSENYKDLLPERLDNQALFLTLALSCRPPSFPSCHPRKFLTGIHLQDFSVHLKTVSVDPATALTSDPKQNIIKASCKNGPRFDIRSVLVHGNLMSDAHFSGIAQTE